MKNYRQFTESYIRIQEMGSTYALTINIRGRTLFTQMFFPNVFTRPTRTAVLQSIRKIYPNAKLISYNPSMRDTNKPLLVSGEQ